MLRPFIAIYYLAPNTWYWNWWRWWLTITTDSHQKWRALYRAPDK